MYFYYCNILRGFSHSVLAMSLEDAEDGAHQGLLDDGGGADPEPGAPQAPGAEKRGTCSVVSC